MSWRDGSEVAKYVGEEEEEEGEDDSGVRGEGRKKNGHFAMERVEGLRNLWIRCVR